MMRKGKPHQRHHRRKWIFWRNSPHSAATKRSLYEAILYPSSENFVKYFRLQNYWTQQAGLFSMSAKSDAGKPRTRLQPAAQLLQRHGKTSSLPTMPNSDRLSPPSHSTTA
uniref:Uncharacterized protein n=1 Tax=Klebsiella pneumoniae TaxID=573 RepID=A0A2P1BNR8_KLEPN|nr:hypothetical protein [Klebsiella pneumoniae]